MPVKINLIYHTYFYFFLLQGKIREMYIFPLAFITIILYIFNFKGSMIFKMSTYICYNFKSEISKLTLCKIILIYKTKYFESIYLINIYPHLMILTYMKKKLV